MIVTDRDRPDWRLAGDLDNENPIYVLSTAKSGDIVSLWLTDRLFAFKRTVNDGGEYIDITLSEVACVRQGENLDPGTFCLSDPVDRAIFRESFVWRDYVHYEKANESLRADVVRLFFEGFMERARDAVLTAKSAS